MKVIAVAVLLAYASCSIILTSDEEYALEFGKFLQRFNKTYESMEDSSYRFSVFKDNYDMIKKHNAEGHSWTLAVNAFADETWEEFRAKRLGYRPVAVRGIERFELNLAGLVTVPDSVDWTEKNVVTAIKNQGQCGSCWAFSTTGSVESAVAIKSGDLTSLSEQQLVDCSTSEGNMGCNGGLMDDGFEYVISNDGLCTEASYPYTAKDGTCKSCTAVSTISSYVDVTADNEDALQAAVAQQPVSVAIEADKLGFQFYSGGVFSGRCGTSLDHGVLVVGYGNEDGTDYWKVKNSWGASWGMDGYILLARGVSSSKGQCGIAMQPSYPIA